MTRREIAGFLEKVGAGRPESRYRSPADGALPSLEQHRIETARIKVEAVMGEDQMVDLLEVLELYCELLLARFGLLETVRCVSLYTGVWAEKRIDIDSDSEPAGRLTLEWRRQ